MQDFLPDACNTQLSAVMVRILVDPLGKTGAVLGGYFLSGIYDCVGFVDIVHGTAHTWNGAGQPLWLCHSSICPSCHNFVEHQ